MTKRIDLTFDLPLTPAEFAERLTTPEFALTRLHAARRDDPELISLSSTPGRTRVSARYFSRIEEMPSWMASRFTDHGPENVRTEDWTFAGEQLGADFTVESTGNASRVEGRYDVTATATGSSWRVTAAVSAKIPVLGRKIEAVIAESLARAYAGEAQEMSRADVRIG